MKTCSKCKTSKPTEKFHKDKTTHDGLMGICILCKKNYAQKNKIHFQIYRKEYQLLIKKEVFFTYGNGTCACCGETEITFLTLDHINNDGQQHRKIIKGGKELYRWLKIHHYPKNILLQVLCFNCNCAKAILGYCPHQKNTP